MKIGIDLGGTKTEAILIENNGKELFRKRIQTEKNYDGTIHGILSLIREIENNFQIVSSIGIGMPGIVSKYTSLVKNANSVWLNGKPFLIIPSALPRSIITFPYSSRLIIPLNIWPSLSIKSFT